MADAVVSNAAPAATVVDAAKPETVTTETAKPADTVDLKAWAKTSSENRRLKADVEKLNTDLKAAQTAMTAEAFTAKIVEELKKPGAKKLFEAAGYDFNKISDMYLTDDEPENPEIVKLRDEQAKLRKEIDDKKKKEDDDRTAAQKAADDAKVAENIKTIGGFVTENADKLVSDPKDIRNGTPRWVFIVDDSDAFAAANQAYVDYVTAKTFPNEEAFAAFCKENSAKLIEQALDKIEIQLRTAVMPKIDKLRPKNTNISSTGTKEARTTDTDWRPKNSIPALAIDRGNTSSPAPVAAPKQRFTSGPVKITYT
jgi:hypothetical protein